MGDDKRLSAWKTCSRPVHALFLCVFLVLWWLQERRVRTAKAMAASEVRRRWNQATTHLPYPALWRRREELEGEGRTAEERAPLWSGRRSKGSGSVQPVISCLQEALDRGKICPLIERRLHEHARDVEVWVRYRVARPSSDVDRFVVAPRIDLLVTFRDVDEKNRMPAR